MSLGCVIRPMDYKLLQEVLILQLKYGDTYEINSVCYSPNSNKIWYMYTCQLLKTLNRQPYEKVSLDFIKKWMVYLVSSFKNEFKYKLYKYIIYY